jgi:hypothetical protein
MLPSPLEFPPFEVPHGLFAAFLMLLPDPSIAAMLLVLSLLPIRSRRLRELSRARFGFA